MNLLSKPLRSPSRTIPLIPVRDVVVFPHNEVVLTFGRRKSVLAINASMRHEKLVVLFTQKDSSVNDPSIDELYNIGTLCVVERTLKSDDELNALVRGIARVKLKSIVSDSPVTIARVQELHEVIEETDEVEALSRHLSTQFKDAVNQGKTVEFMNFMKLMSGLSASELVDQIAATLTIETAEKQKLLETLNLKTRLEKVNELLGREVKVLQIEKSIASKTQEKFSKSMREAVLRERMQTIKQELGEIDGTEEEIEELEKQINELNMPQKSKDKALKELDRLARMSPHNPEYNYIRTWLDTIIEVPWGIFTDDRVSLNAAEEVLEDDHYGLEEVKERILEYLAVMKLKKKNGKKPAPLPTILCFVGPPGVGKTSIGRSIARALKREFIKISLGGIRDEAEIRGHRRTYVGAMPGRIIEGIRQAGSQNPVFMLDEIDKVGTDYRGDPSAALLEALDPEQNKEFSDHYLELDYDLSRTMFIATANILDTIPPALRDRLEIIRFSGYTENEKYHIAKSHLLEKVLEKNALVKKDLNLSKATLLKIIKSYTREAGVRNLERELAKLARKIARLKSTKKKIPTITTRNLKKYLGPEKYLSTVRERTNPVGMATGLAWTQSGGDILFVEVELMPGKGRLQITGQLGDVMKESARASVSYVRSHWKELKIAKDFYKDMDIHIHVPEGAVPKDGPSAGVTITTALVSALTGRKTKKEVGMTGENTLRGRVLEIGGLKEKIIAAHSAGLRDIIFPHTNEKDLEKIPEEVRSALRFHPVKSMSELLSIALVE